MAMYDMEMVLEWAKVFPENADMGDVNGNRAAQAVAAKGGQYIVNAYLTSSDQKDQLLEGGLDPKPMNHDRFLQGNESYGIGEFIKLKRLVSDVKTFTDRHGKEFTKDYGGAPKVVDLRSYDGENHDTLRMWSFEEDGPLGNGTVARVQFETYANGAGVRLLNIGVTELVEYSSESSNDSPGWAMVG